MKQLWAPWRLEYIEAADEQDGCIFCRAAGLDDEEGLVVHRGENAFVLVNKFPYVSGHLMVGIIDHVHLHVVPRWAGDTNFMPVLADVKVLPEHLLETRRRLADAWPTA